MGSNLENAVSALVGRLMITGRFPNEGTAKAVLAQALMVLDLDVDQIIEDYLGE